MWPLLVFPAHKIQLENVEEFPLENLLIVIVNAFACYAVENKGTSTSPEG